MILDPQDLEFQFPQGSSLSVQDPFPELRYADNVPKAITRTVSCNYVIKVKSQAKKKKSQSYRIKKCTGIVIMVVGIMTLAGIILSRHRGLYYHNISTICIM